MVNDYLSDQSTSRKSVFLHGGIIMQARRAFYGYCRKVTFLLVTRSHSIRLREREKIPKKDFAYVPYKCERERKKAKERERQRQLGRGGINFHRFSLGTPWTKKKR